MNLGRVPLLWSGVVRRWRRSLQLRVVATTLFASAVVVAVLGVVVLGQVRQGLLDAKNHAALAQASAGLRFAQGEIDAQDKTGPADLARLLNQVEADLAPHGGIEAYDVVLEKTASSGPLGSSGLTTCDERCSGSVPKELRAYVQRTAQQGYQYTRIRHTHARSNPGLAVGAPVATANAGAYELYYLFPLTQENDTLGLVRSTLAYAGISLVLLLAAIAFLVTRQVVAPVRAAALTAERLSAGRLEERMRVRGEDDLARLATSFNVMAAGLQAQIRRLEELSRLQRRFVADVSHELRTPLTTVRMAADVLHENRESFDPAVARSTELLQAQLDRFESLLADLLEISKHDAGAVVLEAEPTDLRTLVDRAVDSTEPIAARRGSTLRVEAPLLPVIAEVDTRRIERILRNLLVNAIEHGEGRDVVVRVAQDDYAAAITVRDLGVGLAPGQAAMVFDRFWRADPARARTTGGTGLGLSIALEDAHLHGGWLEASGQPGGGAVFRLTLPRVVGESFTRSPLPVVPHDEPSDAAPVSPGAGGMAGD